MYLKLKLKLREKNRFIVYIWKGMRFKAYRRSLMGICNVRGCNDKRVAKGYCKKHYSSFTLHGDAFCVGNKRVEINKQMSKVRFVKINTAHSDLNWWLHHGIVGQTFEVFDIVSDGYVKIKYGKKLYGWLPLDVCEINPHLKLIK